ncbi:MAG: hypothetical protein AB8G22_28440 [Saprospiraceae bacterium]
MKILLEILILFTILRVSCSENVKPEKLNVDKVNLKIEIIPEFGDNGYSISWNDTLCSEFKSKWNYLQLRPYELYCYITNNNNDTLGYYRGLSSPQQFTYFETKVREDSIIKVDFLVGINHFSEFLSEQTPKYINQFNENNKERIVFERVEFNLNKDVRKKMVLKLTRIK